MAGEGWWVPGLQIADDQTSCMAILIVRRNPPYAPAVRLESLTYAVSASPPINSTTRRETQGAMAMPIL